MDELEKLYAAVSAKMNVGSFEKFSEKMKTPEQRKSFYQVVSSKGFSLGEYEKFESRLAPVEVAKPKGAQAEGGGALSSPSVNSRSSSEQRASRFRMPTEEDDRIIANRRDEIARKKGIPSWNTPIIKSRQEIEREWREEKGVAKRNYEVLQSIGSSDSEDIKEEFERGVDERSRTESLAALGEGGLASYYKKKGDEGTAMVYQKKIDGYAALGDYQFEPAQTKGTAVEFLPDTDKYGFDPNDLAGFLRTSRKDYNDADKLGALADVPPQVRELALSELLGEYTGKRSSFIQSKMLAASEAKDADKYSELNSQLVDLQKNYEKYVKENLPLAYMTKQDQIESSYKEYKAYKEKGTLTSIMSDGTSILFNALEGVAESIDGEISNAVIALSDWFGADEFAEQERLVVKRNNYVWQDQYYSEASGSKYNYKGTNYLITESGMIIDTDAKRNITGIVDRLGLSEEKIKSGKGLGAGTSTSGLGYVKDISSTLGSLAFQMAVTKGIGSAVGATTLKGMTLTSVGVQSGLVASSVYNETYTQLSDAGIEANEAKAQSMKVALGTTAATMPAFLFSPNLPPVSTAGSKSLFSKEFAKEAAQAYVSAGKNGAIKYTTNFVKAGTSEFGEELLEGTVQNSVNGLVNQALGKDILSENTSVEEYKQLFITSFLVGGMGSIPKTFSDRRNRLINLEYLSQDMDTAETVIDGIAEEGTFTQQQAETLKKELNLYHKYSNQVPEDMPIDKAQEIFELLDEREKLEIQLKTQKKAFHKGIKNSISEIDDKVAVVMGRKEPDTIDDVSEAFDNEAVVGESLLPVTEVAEASVKPENSSNYANLTEDGEDFVFFHKGGKGYTEVRPSTGESTKTSREEAAAMAKVGGLAMYYPNLSDSERQSKSDSTYSVRVAKDKVYDFNSDPLNLIEEAEARHKEEHPDKVFDPNTQVAYVAKIAGEKGFEMVISEWGDGKTRAQTTSALKPTEEMEMDGNKVTKPFSKTYSVNRDKGFESVVPKTKRQALQGVYDAMSTERSKAKKYDALSKLYDNSGNYTQDEITKMVNESDLSEEVKTQYQEALDYKPEGRSSKLKNNAVKTQGFFGDVVSGKSDKYIPSKAYEYEKKFKGTQEEFRKRYDKKKGSFDEHIAASIPTFRETQVQKGAAIVEMYSKEGGLVYDLGGSEGGFSKTITEQSKGKIRSINLEPNQQMKEASDRNPVRGSEQITEAFYEGFDNILAHKPKEKADVVHESMLFQFLTPDRDAYISEVKSKYLKGEGLFITEEKFKIGDEKAYSENEKIKDEQHKSKYFTEEQKKLKGEDVLIGMDKNQANYNSYLDSLKKEFKHVATYWTSGNFRGIVATDSKQKLDEFLGKIGDTSNPYTYKENEPTKQKSKSSSPKAKGEGATDTSESATTTGDTEISDRAKEIADSIRIKFKTNTKFKDGLSNLSSGAPKAVFDLAWDGAVEAVALSVQAGGNMAQAVKNGVNHLKGTDWYKSLSDSGKKSAVSQFEDSFAEESTQQDIDNDYAQFEAAAAKSKADTTAQRKKTDSTWKKIVERFSEEVFDRAFGVKNALTKAGFKDTISYLVTKAGASSLSKNRSETVYAKTFKGLSDNDIELLEKVILAERIIAIDKNRAERGLKSVKHQGGVTGNSARNTLTKYAEEWGQKKFDDMKKRAEAYFDEYKRILTEMRDEGIISQESYEMFAEVNYQPREFVQFLKDADGDFMVEELEGIESTNLSKKQLQTMRDGSEGSQLMDAWYIMQKSILGRTKAVFSNRMNSTFAKEFEANKAKVEALKQKDPSTLTKKEKALIAGVEDLSKRVKTDKNIGFTKAGNTKFERDGKNNKGYKPVYYYEDGVKKRFWLEDGLHSKLMDETEKHLTSAGRENLALVTGTSTVKTLATGNNPLFFITNTPRDFLFTLNFSQEYGDFILTEGIKLAVDMVKGVKSVVTNGDNYKKFLEFGGGMDYLALQGKYNNKGWTKALADSVLDQRTQRFFSKNKVSNTIAKFNLASEVGIRMAVFNKSVSNQLKKEHGGKTIDQLTKDQSDLVYTNAVRAARELTDFNQGGRAFKAADAAIPYLNAATQGTRAAIEATVKNPISVVSRIAQTTALTAGATMAMANQLIGLLRDEEDEEIKGMKNAEVYLKTIEGVSEYDLKNYFIFPRGQRDEKGNWKYYRMAKAQALSPFLNTIEHYMRKALAKSSGASYRGKASDAFVGTVMDNILPVSPTLKGTVGRIPAASAFVASLGIDAYTGNDLDWDRGKIPAELEGITSDRVEPMFKKFGEVVGYSPIRMQKVVESYVTTPNTSPYVAIAYSVGNMTFADETTKELLPNVGEMMEKSLTGRFSKTTSEYNSVTKLLSESSKEVVDIYRKNIIVEDEIRTAIKELKEGKLDSSVVEAKVKELSTKYPETTLDIMKWVKSEVGKTKMSPLTARIKYETNKEVRALLIVQEYGDEFVDPTKLDPLEKKVFNELVREKVFDQETLAHYARLLKERN